VSSDCALPSPRRRADHAAAQPPAPEPEPREIPTSALDGMRFDANRSPDPELSRAFWEQPGDSARRGESWNETNGAAGESPVVEPLNTAHPISHIIAWPISA